MQIYKSSSQRLPFAGLLTPLATRTPQLMGATVDRIVDGPIVALDIFEYSRREEREQVDAQRLVDRILSESCAAIGASILGADWVDAGDGGFLLIQGDLRAGLHVLEAFVGRLADENRRRAEQFRVHLRFALHYGTVRLWDGRQGHNAAANALNESARLLAGMASANIGQIVCSGIYRQQLVTIGDKDPTIFARLRDTVDKHGNRHEVWNVHRAPSLGIDPPSECRHSPVGPAVNGGVKTGHVAA